jgi:serine/threonine-protein kinase
VRDGDRIGPYRIVGLIGSGGMGAVYRAEHTLIGRQAAIKVLLPMLSSERANVDRFFNEARATSAVSDPGIVQVFDFGVTPDGSAYIVMEVLDGESLEKRLDRLGALPQVDALRIVRQVAGSLAAAHSAGIVHRDLKPDNLMMIADADAPGGERPKILDFGIAKLGENRPDRIKTRTGAVMGTPMYMSPEQCSGAGAVDFRADIYALGCVLFRLVTGRPPFDLPGLGDILSAHLREPPPSPRSIVPNLLPEVDELILRCLAKQPDHRFASMIELQRACDAILARITASGAQTVALPSGSMPFAVPAQPPRTTLSLSAGSLPAPPPQRRLGLWAGLFALAATAGIVAAVIAHRANARTGERPAAAVPMPSVAPSEPELAPVAPSEPAPTPPPTIVETAVPAAVEPTPEVAAPAPRPIRKSRAVKAKQPVKRTKDNDLYDDR